MRIALVKAQDSANLFQLNAVQYPVNIGYLASVCLKEGHEVQMWDFCVEPFTDEYIWKKITQFKPDAVGVSCVTPAINYGHHVMKLVKEWNPHTLTLVGGIHISALPIDTMRDYPHFDLGIIAEAENILIDVLNAFEQTRSVPEGIEGTVYRKNGEVRLAAPPPAMPDVNDIPFTNRDLIPFDWYRSKHALRGFSRQVWNIIEMDSSRGCPYSCTFCGIDVTHGKGVRFRTPENIYAEVEECVKKYQTNFIIFNDSTFTVRKQRVLDIIRGLPSRGIRGYTVNAHVNTVDKEMLDTLAETGCKKISFGVESGSEKTLKAIKKNSTRERIIRAFDLSHAAGIPTVEGTFIVGADLQETDAEVQETYDLIKRIKPDIVALGIITPYPGTPQYVELKEAGYLKDIPWEAYQIFSDQPPPWRTFSLTAEGLVRWRNKILKSYVWTPRFILNRLRVIRSWKELLYYVRLAKTFFKIVVMPRLRLPERFGFFKKESRNESYQTAS